MGMRVEECERLMNLAVLQRLLAEVERGAEIDQGFAKTMPALFVVEIGRGDAARVAPDIDLMVELRQGLGDRLERLVLLIGDHLHDGKASSHQIAQASREIHGWVGHWGQGWWQHVGII